MHLPIFIDALSLSVKSIGGVVHVSGLVHLRNRPRLEIHVMLLGQFRESPDELAVLSFRIDGKVLRLIRTVPHFRKGHQVASGHILPRHQRFHLLQILVLVRKHFGLQHRNLHLHDNLLLRI